VPGANSDQYRTVTQSCNRKKRIGPMTKWDDLTKKFEPWFLEQNQYQQTPEGDITREVVGLL
jgi:hypothetical protein